MVGEVKRGKGEKERVKNEERKCERLEECDEGKDGRGIRKRGGEGQRKRDFWEKDDGEGKGSENYRRTAKKEEEL